MPIRLHIDAKRGWDYGKEEFVEVKEHDVELEHCLLAIARWESKWKKPFFTDNHTRDEWLDYIRCMALDTEEDEYMPKALTSTQLKAVFEYINDSKTATWFAPQSSPPSDGTQMTSELAYYYMAQVPLPFDICERWHLSRLVTILKIASIKSQPDKKMTSDQIARQNRELNRSRHAQVAKMHKPNIPKVKH